MSIFSRSLQTTLVGIAAFLPNLLGAIAVLIVGWILAAVLARISNAVLERLGFDNLIERGRVRETMVEHGSEYDPSRIVGTVVFWSVLVTTFLLAADILGLKAVSVLLTRLIAFMPFVAVAVIAVVVAVALAQIAYDAIVALIGERVEGSHTIAAAAKWGIIVFGVFIALSQLQIAPAIVNGLFLAVVGGLALAFAISFGLGNVDLAKDVTRDWHNRGWGTTKREAEAEQRRRDAA